MSNEREKIAARLKEARTLAGLSQNQAADKMGLQRPAISEIEAGKRKVTAEEIIQFAELYKVEKSWLLLDEADTEKELPAHVKLAAREFGKLNPKELEKLTEFLKMIRK